MNCLNVLNSEYAELEELGFLHSAMRHVFPRYVHVLKSHPSSHYWVGQEGNESRLSKIESRPETEFRGLFILAWGSFEEFLRKYIKETAILWNKKGHHVPASRQNAIWSQHALACAKVVTDAVEGRGLRKVDLEQISIDMQRGICASEPWSLNPEALSMFGGHMDTEQLEKYGRRVGVDLRWSKIGEGEGIKNLSGKVGAAAAGDWAMITFCSIRDKRNGFAHEGVGQGGCPWSDVEEAIEFLRVLGERLVERTKEDIGA
jgi:hypothetical protein